MDGPMARTVVFTPDHLLERQAVLGLTPQQVQRLTALRDAAKSAHDAQHALAMKHMEQLATLTGSADTTAVRAAFMAHHTAMADAHWIMLRAAVQAKAVLTEVQRARVEGWVDAMQAHRAQGGGMGAGMGAGMGHGPGPHRP
jgi:Spy/CpxP family protein refolding chaperone